MEKVSDFFINVQRLVEQDCSKQVFGLPGYSDKNRYTLKDFRVISFTGEGILAYWFVENFGNVTFTVDYNPIEKGLK